MSALPATASRAFPGGRPGRRERFDFDGGMDDGGMGQLLLQEDDDGGQMQGFEGWLSDSARAVTGP